MKDQPGGDLPAITLGPGKPRVRSSKKQKRGAAAALEGGAAAALENAAQEGDDEADEDDDDMDGPSLSDLLKEGLRGAEEDDLRSVVARRGVAAQLVGQFTAREL